MRKAVFLGDIIYLLKQEKQYEYANTYHICQNIREKFASSINNCQLYFNKESDLGRYVREVKSIDCIRRTEDGLFDIIINLGNYAMQKNIFGEFRFLKNTGLYFIYEYNYELKKFLRDFLRGVPEENHDAYKLTLQLNGVDINESSTCTD